MFRPPWAYTELVTEPDGAGDVSVDIERWLLSDSVFWLSR